MNCEDAMESICGGVDGPMSAGEDKRLSEHLRGCEKCRAESRKLNRLEEILRSVPEPPVSRARLGETLSAVSLEVHGRGRNSAAYQRVRVWAAVAAAVVIAAGIGFLFGRSPVTPSNDVTGAEEQVPAKEASRLTAAQTEVEPAREEEPVEPGFGSQEEASIIPLVEKLVQADLALSEAKGPGHKAVIFCAMCREVVAELQDSVDRSDIEGVRTLGRGYTRLVRDGILPNVKVATGDKDHDGVRQVIDSLKGNREVLGLLAARMEDHGRSLLAEALSASEECLSAAEGVLQFF